MPIVTPSTDFTFLDAVNRILMINGIIRGDTDLITSFSDLQHSATVTMAQIAVQDEISDLVSDTLIPSEHESSGTLSAVASTRSYSLPSDFVRFFGVGSLFNSDENIRIYEFPGGEPRLMNLYTNYKTQESSPIHWYFDMTTTKKIALWPVTQEDKNYTFDYQSDVQVAASTDTLPFHNNSESFSFCRLAARRFKVMFEGGDMANLNSDPERMTAKSTLVNLIQGNPPPKMYANTYR
jgi:hypothetical protein